MRQHADALAAALKAARAELSEVRARNETQTGEIRKLAARARLIQRPSNSFSYHHRALETRGAARHGNSTKRAETAPQPNDQALSARLLLDLSRGPAQPTPVRRSPSTTNRVEREEDLSLLDSRQLDAEIRALQASLQRELTSI